MSARVALVLPLALATACSLGSPDAPTVTDDLTTVAPGMGDIDRTPIIYGGSAPDADHHGAVVALHYRSGTTVYGAPFCTGTLIADDVVLTAAHCVDVAPTRARNFVTMSASNLVIYVGDDPSSDLIAHAYVVDDIEIYSDYDRRRSRNDIALVRLSTDITEDVTPVPGLPSSEGFDSSDVGETLNFAGFGDTETGSTGVKLQADGELAGTGCVVPACSDSGDADTQISYRQDRGTGPCYGDSGGPAFVFRGGTTYVGGVTSYGDAYCLAYGVSTRVDAYESWITDYVGPVDTGGGTGDGGSTDGGSTDGGSTDGGSTDGGTPEPYCGDGVCGEGESCDGFKSGTIDCNEDCPGDMTGPRRLRYCYVEGECKGPGCP